jgi:hypothetical protein
VHEDVNVRFAPLNRSVLVKKVVCRVNELGNRRAPVARLTLVGPSLVRSVHSTALNVDLERRRAAADDRTRRVAGAELGEAVVRRSLAPGPWLLVGLGLAWYAYGCAM